jgi:outer membrane receptor protein involved in Fe transport
MNRRISYFAAIVALSAAGAAGAAAPELEEVTVTAQKRVQNIQDVPLSLSALSADSLSKLGMSSFREWADYIPGITMSYGLNSRRGGPAAVIRGVTNQVRGGIGDNTANATTAFTIGEIPIFSVSPDLSDMQRIEVLKGPQGTLYGIAAMGGVVRYIPNDADTKRFAARVKMGGGLINEGGSVEDVSGMVNLPLVEGKFAVRFSGNYSHNGGFIDHIFPTLNDSSALVLKPRAFDYRTDVDGHYQRDSNSSTTKGGRVAATWTPTDKLSIRLSSMWNETAAADSSQMDRNDPADLVISRYVLQPQSSQFKLTSLEAGYDLGFGRIEYIGGYYENDLSETVDATRFVAQQLVPLNGDTFYPDAIRFPFVTHSHQDTHELRLQGQNKSLGFGLFGSPLTLDYVVGGFYQHEVRRGYYNIVSPDWNANKGPNTQAILTEGGLILGATGVGDYRNKAVFADVTLHLTPKLSVGGGARKFDQSKVTDGRGFGGSGPPPFADNLDDPDFYANGRSRGSASEVVSKGTTPRATVSYRFDDDRMMYVTAANGQRIGATAPLSTVPIIQPPECEALMRSLGLYDPFINGTKSDSVWSYDLGFRSTWLDKRLLINAAVYRVDWTDLQQVVILNSVDRNCSQVIQANVGAAQIKGFELEAAYSIGDHYSLNLTSAYANAEITDAPPGVKDSIGAPLEKGDSVNGVPEWTGSFGAEYHRDIASIAGFAMDSTAYLRADWRYVSERINGFGDKPSLRAGIPFNVAKAYQLTDVRAGLQSDEWEFSIYVSNVFDKRAEFESLGNYFQPNIQEIAVSQPRTIGINISKNF